MGVRLVNGRAAPGGGKGFVFGGCDLFVVCSSGERGKTKRIWLFF